MRPPSADRRRRGFTLLELMLAAGVMVVAGAIIVPSLVALQQSNQLPGMADDLRALLVSLRTKAMDDGSAYEFALGAGGGSYILRKADEAANAAGSQDADGRVELDRDGAFGEHPLPESLRLEAAGANGSANRSAAGSGGAAPANGSVRFNPDGTSSGFSFRLVGDTGAFMFRVRTLTGAVKCERQALGAAGGGS